MNLREKRARVKTRLCLAGEVGEDGTGQRKRMLKLK